MELASYVIPKDKESIAGQLWWTVTNIILARYQYDGLEGTNIKIDSIERALMHSGMCAIFKEGDELVALPCVMTELDIYGRPRKVTAYAYAPSSETGFKTLRTDLVVGEDCALILNNSQAVSNIAMITPYIKRLSKIWKELGNNLKLSRVFAMVAGNSAIAKNFVDTYNKMLDSGVAVVSVADMSTYTKNLEKFDFKIEYRQEQYHNDFDATWQMLITMLGINNVGNEKRERLLVDEVNANNELLNVITDTTRVYREAGLKQANELFGTNFAIKERDVIVNKTRGESETPNKEIGGDDNQ